MQFSDDADEAPFADYFLCLIKKKQLWLNSIGFPYQSLLHVSVWAVLFAPIGEYQHKWIEFHQIGVLDVISGIGVIH